MLFSKRLQAENERLLQENNGLLAKNRDLEQRVDKLELEIERLKRENCELTDRYQPYVNAKTNAESLCESERDRLIYEYNLQFDRLKAFIVRWQANLPEDRANTPENKKRSALADILSRILQENAPISDLQAGAFLVEKLNGAIGGKNPDDEGAFDLDAVLNPGKDLDLAALCKELGVMD